MRGWRDHRNQACGSCEWPRGVGLLAVWGIAGWLSFAPVALGQTDAPRVDAVASRLDAVKDTLAGEVSARLRTNVVRGSYTTVWRQFEDVTIATLGDLLPKRIAGLREADLDSGRSGAEKNRLADLAIHCANGVIEVSIKSARASANPENDLGTFRDHPNRKKLFAASFTLWVRYEDTGEEVRCDRVFFDRSWRFVGKSSLVDGVKYRKKDGNMRPKPWAMFESGAAYWKTEAEFEAAVQRAEVYRANEIIKQYLEDLNEDDQRLLYERLKGKFQPAEHLPAATR